MTTYSPPDKAFVITLKWIYKVKLDELGESFAPVARLEAIRIFLAFAAHMNMVVYQMECERRESNAPRSWYDMFVFNPEFPMTSQRLSGSYTVHLKEVDTPMVEKSKLDEDKEGKAVDPHTIVVDWHIPPYLTAINTLDLQFAICMCAAEFRARCRKALKCGKKDLSVSKRNRTSGTLVSEGFFHCTNSICRCGSCWLSRYMRATSSIEAGYIALSVVVLQVDPHGFEGYLKMVVEVPDSS
ncbi:hypothetical protein Tco_0461225 [Tanacetum coccineum]